ncbi:hypothetical protein D3C78_1264300 [compost metagenome]
MMERRVSDFPEPDSPTRPMLSPAPIVRFTSETNVLFDRVASDKFSTCKIGFIALISFSIHLLTRLLQGITRSLYIRPQIPEWQTTTI